jgi:UDP-3-O-[3-hydroxymyristoyl] N-acetylglucosamine deacetylase
MIIQGIGGHSGQEVTLDIQPSKDQGIWFTLPQGRVRAHLDNVISTNMCTTIKQGEVYISTIEHLLSACTALGIHRLNITVIGGNEIPLMDGSALPFYESLKSLIPDKQLTFWKDRQVIRVENDRGWIEFTPHDEMIFDVTVNAPFPTQHFVFNASKDSYYKEIASARTFGLYKDGERLKQNGMALGSNFTNTIILSDQGKVLNPEGLRYPEELARHKILDAMGDLALGEMQITGYYRAVNPGHSLNIDLLRQLRACE